MARYIDADALIELAYSRIDGIDRLYGQSHPDASDWEYAINNSPTIDAVPVVHGEWIKKPFLLGTTNVCNRCWRNYGMPHEVFNYCPNCGAKMNRGKND